MKQIRSRGAALLMALVLTFSAVPDAAAQTCVTPLAVVGVFRSAKSWETAGSYSEGMILVTDGVHWGYAGTDGSLVIGLRFDKAEPFCRGTALVTEQGKTGLLHWNGTYLLEPEYNELTDLGCGIYLGRRGSVWDLVSITLVPSVREVTHRVYANQISAELSAGQAARYLVLRAQDGTVTRISINDLPKFLEINRIPGWQFPLSSGRQAEFQDVSGEDWFDRWVNLAYCVGLMEGTGNGLFEPLRTLTVAETLRLAACLESRALQDDFHLQKVSGPVWYSSSVAYCEASGIILSGEFTQADFSRPVTRAEMAHIFARTTPVRGMELLNSLSQVQNSVPDVSAGAPAASAIYGLYAKGVVNGVDSSLAFHPSDSLTRAEAAAIVSRIARPEQRITLW